MNLRLNKKILLHFSALFIFSIFCIRYWLNAQGKPFWTDESDGIFNVASTSWKQLFMYGLNGQSSRSPLYYILDKAWYEWWNYRPQLYWDLRVFFRILPALYWALACIAVFYYAFIFINRKLPHLFFWQIYIVSLGITFFYYHHSFMHIYAIETRASSLWIALSTIHFLFFLESIDEVKMSIYKWVTYCLVALLLVLTTYAAILQVLLAVALFFLRQYQQKKFLHMKETIIPIALVSIPSLFGTFWYFTQLDSLNYGRPTLAIYFSSVMEIFLKSFHHHGIEPAFVTIPLFLLLIPYWLRKDTLVSSGAINGYVLVLFSFLQFKISQWKGYIYAPRYAAFLVPIFSWFYFLGIYFLIDMIIKKISQKFSIPKNSVVYIILCLSIIEISNGIIKAKKEITHNIALARSRNVYKLTPMISECSQALSGSPIEMEKINDLCREM